MSQVEKKENSEMTEWYAPLMQLDTSKFIDVIKHQSSEELLHDVVPYSSPNISETSELFRSAEAQFGTDVVMGWNIVHWVIYRLMLMREELKNGNNSRELVELKRSRASFKNTVMEYFRGLHLPTHNLVIYMDDLWKATKQGSLSSLSSSGTSTPKLLN